MTGCSTLFILCGQAHTERPGQHCAEVYHQLTLPQDSRVKHHALFALRCMCPECMRAALSSQEYQDQMHRIKASQNAAASV